MQTPPSFEDVDALARLAVQLPILTGVAIVVGVAYLVVRFDDARRRRERAELVELIVKILDRRDEDRKGGQG